MSREHNYFVYILASGKYGTLYIGVTNDLVRRVGEHREGRASIFTRKQCVTQLMWFEIHHDIIVAIQREKAMKTWSRAWKTNLIERDNQHWQDLYAGVCGTADGPTHALPSGTMGPAHKGQDDSLGDGGGENESGRN